MLLHTEDQRPDAGSLSSTRRQRGRGVCLVIAAPSGAGKSTIARALLIREPGAVLSVSVTTRAPRAGEQEGIHYLFRTQAAFDAMVRDNQFLEYARVFDRSYGTLRAPVEQALSDGCDVIFDIDWQGHRQLRRTLPDDVVGAFILPPSLDRLESRLRQRGDAGDQVTRRMQAARDELSHAAEFDYLVVNDDLDEAIDDVAAVLRAARLATKRRASHVLG